MTKKTTSLAYPDDFHCSRCGRRLATDPKLTNSFGWCKECEAAARWGYPRPAPYVPNPYPNPYYPPYIAPQTLPTVYTSAGGAAGHIGQPNWPITGMAGNIGGGGYV